MVSILIPIYNRAHLIVETLQSIVAQSYENWECILVDDGSTDATPQVVQDFIAKDARFIFLNRPDSLEKGPSSCRNYAFEKSSGAYIQFFDSDDIMHPNHLSEKIEKIGNADLVVCKLKPFYDSFDAALYHYSDSNDLVLSGFAFDDFVSGRFEMMMVAPLWKKAYIASYMPILTHLNMLEDHELYARALFDAPKMVICNHYLIFYRKGHDALTTSFFKDVSSGLNSYLYAKQTVLNLKNTNPIQLILLKQVLGYFRLGLAAKQYQEAQKCLSFISKNKLAFSFSLKLKLLRIKILFVAIKTFKRGDFFLKPYLKV